MSQKYLPYVNAYGQIGRFFEEITKASVPPKVTQDFLSTVLGLKSSSYRAMIPLLKRLDFIDQNSVPTEKYKEFRDSSCSKRVMADSVRKAYSDLYSAAEYAHKLSKEELTAKLISLLGVGKDDSVIPAIVGTFTELVKLSDFEAKPDNKHDSSGKEESHLESAQETKLPSTKKEQISHRLGISYTINLNLPATTEIEVYNSIFKALKENLLNE